MYEAITPVPHTLLVIVLVALYLLTPALAGWLQRRDMFGWLDPVWTCYGVGLLMANTPIPVDAGVANTVTEAVIPLAIPLLLFRTDVVRWLSQSRRALLAFLFAASTVSGSVLLVSQAFAQMPHIGHIAGMMTATLTGGTPNLLSVGKALETPEEILVLTNTADMVTGGAYLLFLLTIAQGALARILPTSEDALPMELGADNPLTLKERVVEAGITIVLGVVIALASVGIAWGITGELNLPLILLGLTTGGIAASFSDTLRAMRTNFDIGNYLILVFCVAIGSLTDLHALLANGTQVVLFAAGVILLALIAHYTLCAIFRIDVDTAIIASTASLMGPALVVPVARRLDNQQAFLSGLTSGLIGYALGNYLGLLMASLVGG